MTGVQAVLLYGSETWVLTPHIWSILGGLHHRVAHWLKGQQPWRVRVGSWVYPYLVEAITEVGLQEVEIYASNHQIQLYS